MQKTPKKHSKTVEGENSLTNFCYVRLIMNGFYRMIHLINGFCLAFAFTYFRFFQESPLKSTFTFFASSQLVMTKCVISLACLFE